MATNKHPANHRASVWRTVKSVAASMFGVQSQQNLQHDFQQPSAFAFIAVGIVFVVLFVVLLASLVSFL